MFKDAKSFSSFSVDELSNVKDFYANILGLEVKETEMGTLDVSLANGEVMIYPKGSGHTPATFTVLNFMVSNIDKAVDELTSKDVKFEHYDNEYMKTDEKGIARSDKPEHGPNIAWFKDPAGNILSVIEEK